MQNFSTEQASTVAFFLHVYIKCRVTNPIWARKIWPLRNEFSKSSTQAIYNAIVWKIFMHWTIVHMFCLSCCGVRRRLREYSFFLIYVLSIAFISLGCFFPCFLNWAILLNFFKLVTQATPKTLFIDFFCTNFAQIAQNLHEFTKIKYRLNLFLLICLNYMTVGLADLRHAIKQEWLEVMHSTTSFLQQFLVGLCIV